MEQCGLSGFSFQVWGPSGTESSKEGTSGWHQKLGSYLGPMDTGSFLNQRPPDKHNMQSSGSRGLELRTPALNAFYAHFDLSNCSKSTRLTISPGELSFSESAEEVRMMLWRIKPHKAAGPDNISGQVLKERAQESKGLLTDIFNLSLSLATVCL